MLKNLFRQPNLFHQRQKSLQKIWWFLKKSLSLSRRPVNRRWPAATTYRKILAYVASSPYKLPDTFGPLQWVVAKLASIAAALQLFFCAKRIYK